MRCPGAKAVNKMTVHGTCVALGDACALLRGAPGAGKSDLALRFLYLPADRLGAEPALVADDQVILHRNGDRIVASCPKLLEGKIEVRGCGIARLGLRAPQATLALVADLDATGGGVRFPEKTEWETLLDVAVRRIRLDPFEPSAPVKLALAIRGYFQEPVD